MHDISYRYFKIPPFIVAIISLSVLNSCSLQYLEPLTFETNVATKSDSNKQQLLSTIEYFSNNYPYSTQQIESFFNNSFVLVSVDSPVLHHFEVDQTTNHNSFVKQIIFKEGITNSQILSIKLKNELCISRPQFKEEFPNFVMDPRGKLLYFARVLDEKNQIGSLGFKVRINDENDKRCIQGVSFGIPKKFDLNNLYTPTSRGKKNITP